MTVPPSTPGLEIRAVASDDEPAWRTLWRAYLDFYETELPEEVYATSFARLCDPGESDYHGILAVLNGVPVGLAHYIFHRHGWRIEPVCYLQDLYTAPEARGRGMGRALIEAVYARADAAASPSVYWLTQDFNKTARRLYDQVAQVTPFIKYARA